MTYAYVPLTHHLAKAWFRIRRAYLHVPPAYPLVRQAYHCAPLAYPLLVQPDLLTLRACQHVPEAYRLGHQACLHLLDPRACLHLLDRRAYPPLDEASLPTLSAYLGPMRRHTAL